MAFANHQNGSIFLCIARSREYRPRQKASCQFLLPERNAVEPKWNFVTNDRNSPQDRRAASLPVVSAVSVTPIPISTQIRLKPKVPILPNFLKFSPTPKVATYLTSVSPNSPHCSIGSGHLWTFSTKMWELGIPRN